jgi:serine/threonine protein kinase
MGIVYQACQTSLGRVVALKVINPERLRDSELLNRFRREVRIAAKLAHANLVMVHDGGVVAGVPFYVMEYLEGIDLAQLVKQSGPLPIARACDCICQVSSGLQHLFEQGFIHRDIKPANLFASIFPSGTAPAMAACSELAGPESRTIQRVAIKILDVGLARWQVASELETVTEVRGEGSPLLGTLDYMAPEQALDCRGVDIRADIYSLGCTLYYLLTGQPPFAGGSLARKLLRHQQEEPERIENLRPNVRPELASIVHRMMAKEPGSRYQRPAEVIFALEPFCNGIRYDVGQCNYPGEAEWAERKRSRAGGDSRTVREKPRSGHYPGRALAVESP